jgi:hypothetical protein
MYTFSPTLVTQLIILPLRYFFGNYAGADLLWSEDEKKSNIEIGHMNDFNKVAIQQRPRVLIGRGDYSINKTGLTDNFVETPAPLPNTNVNPTDRINMVFISGNAQITIEARNQGTCELVTDMVSHFITWARPLLCSTQGFKEFGLPMQVSDCLPDIEDTDKFRVVINLPYMIEEKWTVRQDTLSLKSFFLSMVPK